MGGRNSGRRPSTKRLVAEDCKAITVDAFRTSASRRNDLRAVPQNQLLQYRGFITHRDKDNAKRKIVRSSIDTGTDTQEIFVENTRPGIRGSRWYFRCRTLNNSVFCNKRADTLYLPPGAKQYACRTCHGLTYRRPKAADDR
jgi:hypothetical protein